METHGEREIGLWISLFALSKAFEFFDTAFIILRKKPLIFLHCQSPALISETTPQCSALLTNDLLLYCVLRQGTTTSLWLCTVSRPASLA